MSELREILQQDVTKKIFFLNWFDKKFKTEIISTHKEEITVAKLNRNEELIGRYKFISLIFH